MHENDKFLQYCKFYTSHSKEHRVKPNPLFIKTKLGSLHRVRVQPKINNKCTGSSCKYLKRCEPNIELKELVLLGKESFNK